MNMMATSNAAVLPLSPLPLPSDRSGGRFQNKAVYNRPKRVSMLALPCNTRRVKPHANNSQARSHHIRCAAASNATCAAAVTQPATRESRTITVIPGDGGDGGREGGDAGGGVGKEDRMCGGGGVVTGKVPSLL